MSKHPQDPAGQRSALWGLCMRRVGVGGGGSVSCFCLFLWVRGGHYDEALRQEVVY